MDRLENPTAILYDEDGNAIDDANPAAVRDLDARELLLMILRELRIMNVHLQSMTDEQVAADEVWEDNHVS